MKRLVLSVFFILLSNGVFSQPGLTVVIHDIPNNKGNIMLALYNNPDGFMDKDKTYLNRIVPATKGVIRFDITGILQGNYAVAIYHDSNANGKLDKNMFGIPTEYYGFSNDARGKFGPPSFKDCEISITGYKEIQIHLR